MPYCDAPHTVASRGIRLSPLPVPNPPLPGGNATLIGEKQFPTLQKKLEIRAETASKFGDSYGIVVIVL
jgi:hypothetical protein